MIITANALGHLLHARHCSKCFTYVNKFNLYKKGNKVHFPRPFQLSNFKFKTTLLDMLTNRTNSASDSTLKGGYLLHMFIMAPSQGTSRLSGSRFQDSAVPSILTAHFSIRWALLLSWSPPQSGPRLLCLLSAIQKTTGTTSRENPHCQASCPGSSFATEALRCLKANPPQI